MNEKPKINLKPVNNETYNQLLEREIIVICGRNNSGKSYLLRHLHNKLGDKTSYLPSNRYNNFSHLNVVSNERDKSTEYRNQVVD